MPTVEATPVTSESGLIKMEDRKRPAGHDQNDAAPPLKRQATSLNGNKPHPDADMPWKDDLEVSTPSQDATCIRTELHIFAGRQSQVMENG